MRKQKENPFQTQIILVLGNGGISTYLNKGEIRASEEGESRVGPEFGRESAQEVRRGGVTAKAASPSRVVGKMERGRQEDVMQQTGQY